MSIIEVTGMSGVGKSHFLNILKNSKYKFIYDSDIIDKYNLTDLKLFYIFFKSSNVFRTFILIVKIALKLNFNLLNKLNFIRNTIKKIAKNHFLNALKEKDVVIIDEGISHLYQNIIDENNIDYSIILLIKQLNKLLDITNNIIVVDATDIVTLERLTQRGHKRINNEDTINKFIDNSRIMIRVLLEEGCYNIIHVKNENIIDLEQLVNDIEEIS